MRKILHHVHALVFAFLLVSGFLLHFPTLREPLAAYRLLIVQVHGWVGEFFCLCLAFYAAFLLLRRQRGWPRERYRRFVGFAFLLMCVEAVSGLVVLRKAVWGPLAIAYALQLHRWLAYFALPAVLWHIWAVWPAAAPGSQSQTRRRFFAWLAAGLTGLWAALLLGELISRNRSQNIRGNANCDVFLPAPEPSPESRLPIGGGMKGKFGEYSVANFLPCLHQDTWRFTMDGLVNRSLSFRWEDFVRLPRKVQASDFHCVEGWSVFNITYEGLLVADLLALAGIRPEARYVKFYSADGSYADALTLEQAQLPDVMIVLLMDGKPIPRVLGGPARLIVPRMYAYKAVKWVTRIELIDQPYLGYWEYHGFETDAWVGIY
jgi:DMSO/TMAO reductase YedYZ molybdopterin-dependent catalytic subunit